MLPGLSPSKTPRSHLPTTAGHDTREPATCVVDCANGIGAVAAARFGQTIQSTSLRIQLCNGAEPPAAAPGRLNEGCGSDFVQTRQQWPANARALHTCAGLSCSLDGDADRILFYTEASGTAASGSQEVVSASGPCVLDGDFIACLLAEFIGERVRSAGLADSSLSIGASCSRQDRYGAWHTCWVYLPSAAVPVAGLCQRLGPVGKLSIMRTSCRCRTDSVRKRRVHCVPHRHTGPRGEAREDGREAPARCRRGL